MAVLSSNDISHISNARAEPQSRGETLERSGKVEGPVPTDEEETVIFDFIRWRYPLGALFSSILSVGNINPLDRSILFDQRTRRADIGTRRFLCELRAISA
jgi:hypothetical protein